MTTLFRRRFPPRFADYLGALFFFGSVAEAFFVSWKIALVSAPLLVQNLIIAVAFLVRRPKTGAVGGVRAKVVAYGHGFLIVVFTNLAGRLYPAWYSETPAMPVVAAGIVLYLVGLLLSIRPLYELRHAFSIEPQARELVTTGPYRWARHPIYAAYVVEITGLLMWHFTPAFLVVFLCFLALMQLRIREEERILEAVFPEYGDYRRRVGTFWPKSLRRASSWAAADSSGAPTQGAHPGPAAVS